MMRPADVTEGRAEIRAFDELDELFASAADHLVVTAEQAVEERGEFRIALSGGSTPEGLYRRLAVAPDRDRVPWDRTQVFWGDERWVPHDDPDSNFRMAWECFLGDVPIPEDNVHRVPTGLPDPQRTAERYEDTLRAVFSLPAEGLPRFDLVLLGVGEDGHVASLFPGDPALYERRRLVVAVRAPERPGMLPHARVTMTLEVFNAARDVMVLAAGESKAEAVGRALEEPSDLPASQVLPRAGGLLWLLDRAAAARLPEELQ